MLTKGPSKELGGGRRLIMSAMMDGNRKGPPPGSGTSPPPNVSVRLGLKLVIFASSGHGKRMRTNRLVLLKGFIDLSTIFGICCCLLELLSLSSPPLLCLLKLKLSPLGFAACKPDATDAFVTAKCVAKFEPFVIP